MFSGSMLMKSLLCTKRKNEDVDPPSRRSPRKNCSSFYLISNAVAIGWLKPVFPLTPLSICMDGWYYVSYADTYVFAPSRAADGGNRAHIDDRRRAGARSERRTGTVVCSAGRRECACSARPAVRSERPAANSTAAVGIRARRCIERLRAVDIDTCAGTAAVDIRASRWIERARPVDVGTRSGTAGPAAIDRSVAVRAAAAGRYSHAATGRAARTGDGGAAATGRMAAATAQQGPYDLQRRNADL